MDVESFFLSSLAAEFRKQLQGVNQQVVDDVVSLVNKKHVDKDEIVSIVSTLVTTDDTENGLLEDNDVSNGQ